MKRLALTFAGVLTAACALLSPVMAQAEVFGLHELDASFHAADGSLQMQAGSHPFAYKVNFTVNTKLNPETSTQIPVGELKDMVVSMPPGMVGEPGAVPRCSTGQFVKKACPDSSQIGVAVIQYGEKGYVVEEQEAVYNLEPAPGTVAKIGFVVQVVPVVVSVAVNPNPPHNVIATSPNTSQVLFVYSVKLTIWGDPASPAHDHERGTCATGGGSCPANVLNAPFLTEPTACEGALSTIFDADFWQQPGAALSDGEPDLSDPNWFSQTVESHDTVEPPNPLGLNGCDKLAFNPTVAAKPTTVAAASPTGLDFDLNVEDEGLTSPEGDAASDIKKVAVTLPEGVSANPALAEGLSGCSEADLARETIGSLPGEGCPSESKIGTVEVETPLLEQTLKGSLFLASPYENPFGSLLGLYVVVKNPETGVLLKLPGKVEPNATTGQLVSVFDDLPQLPFNHFRLHFREGERSPLVTPAGCGSYTTQAELTPWANPRSVLHDTATFQVTTGVGGGACPTGGVPPFKPTLVAGTTNNSAGAYSPLDVRITRNDGEQEITGFSSLLPAGVTANLTGVPFCSEAQIASAKAKSGAQEEANPSCPVASEIGHTLVGVGVGSVLAYTPGKLYMAGPFEGAPFSVVAITAAKVGPFDLGTVVVHLPLEINPVTAAVSIPAGASDQIPHIIKGIVVHVRDIRVYVDRSNFTLNPTNCSQSSFSSSVIGSGQDFVSPADDMAVAVSDPFEVANCANLAFKPGFKASTTGKTSRRTGAGLSVKLTYPKATQGTQANIRSVKVDLPKQLPSRLTTLQKACTAAQFEADPAACPAASVVGHAKAITPILPVPIEGPAYFVSHGGAKFPELVIVLQGYGVTIDLHGETFINEKTSVTSSTFHTVPDQPVTSFELTLPQGPNSALAANGNLCADKLKMPTLFTGQNGATIKQSTPITATGCPKKKVKHKDKKAQRATHRHTEGAKKG